MSKTFQGGFPIVLIAIFAAGILWAVRPTSSRSTETPQTLRTGETPAIPLPTGQQTPPRAIFFYLVDVSGSVATSLAPGDRPIDRARRVVITAMEELTDLTEALPQLHTILTIGSVSLSKTPLCRVYAPETTIFAAGDTAAWRSAVAECEATLGSVETEPYTDIHGSLALAGMSLEAADARLKGVVLLSDLKEDLPPGQVPGEPDLTGVCVYVVQLLTPATAANAPVLEQREEMWRDSIISWGSAGARFVKDPGFTGESVLQYFRDCARGKV